MNLLELNAMAEGLLKYLLSKTDQPREVLAILGMSICMLYDTCSDKSVPFADFAKDFNESIIATHKDITNPGPGSLQ